MRADYARRHGEARHRLWSKVHPGIDDGTCNAGAVEVTADYVGDALFSPDLLNQIPAREEIGSVMDDVAKDTRRYHDAIAAEALLPSFRRAGAQSLDRSAVLARR